jgi:hypothetical protein
MITESCPGVRLDPFPRSLLCPTAVPETELAVRDPYGPSLVTRYEAACAESRRVAAGLALDDTVPHPRLGRVSLRWVYVHMIEETARHTGHADILREQTDGATGFDG